MPTSKYISMLMLDLPISGIFDWEYKTKDSALILKWTQKQPKEQDWKKRLRDRVAWTPVVEIRGKIDCVPT